jgi:predicted transcriptional regulator
VHIHMLIDVRTTVVLDDELVKKAKQRAAELRTTLSDVINQALRDAVSRPLTRSSDVKMITFGAGLSRTHHEPKDFKEALAKEDARPYRARF